MEARTVLERLSRGIVLRRRMPARFGRQRIFVSPDASLRFWRPGLRHVDPRLLELVDELVAAGETVWDVGANVGLFAFAAAHHAGRTGQVLALEADPALAALLSRSSQALPPSFAVVEVCHTAVADEIGRTSFSIATRGRATSHLTRVHGSTQTGGTRAVADVPCVTLDALLDGVRRPPSLVKIDVEGAELLALRGASRLLSTVRPRLLCETSAQNLAGVGELLQHHDYQLFDAEQASSVRSALSLPAWNTLAVPREKRAESFGPPATA